IAKSRFLGLHTKITDEFKATLEAKKALGEAALAPLETRLILKDYLVGDRFTTTDIGLFAFTHVAEEGGFRLGSYLAICRWIGHIAAAFRWPRGRWLDKLAL
ncbi:MAG: glutathione binding-like protein, partial [Alphaproteobacteria bacterium]|nr:glutathione binding-like protein [Alphaproteobacteria bacterium]